MKSLILTPHLQQAVIEGRKTQTRSTTKWLDYINENPDNYVFKHEMQDSKGLSAFVFENIECQERIVIINPKYQVNDIVYLRESFRVHEKLDKIPPRNIESAPVEYKLGGTINCIGDYILSPGRWRWHQTMPAHLARTFLKVTDVKVERLRDINDEDCLSEGVEKFKRGFFRFYHEGNIGAAVDSPFISFQSLWKSLYGDGSWKNNPWVFAYTFELCTKEGNAIKSEKLRASAPLR